MALRRGFTLIELSIVLVIIGLLAAGVVVGRSMIETAEARTITTEINLYSTAFKEFIDKYQAIPGDMNNATTYWASDAACPATPNNLEPKTPTCDGDGNGMIGDWTNTATSGNSEREWFRAWQQLANAEFIEGKFTGVAASAVSTDALVGTNVPISKTGKGGWTLLYMASVGAAPDVNFFNSAVASHVLMYGAQTSGSFTDTAVISPIRMKSIDEKLDDGMPYTGKIRTKKSGSGSCTATPLSTTSDYLLIPSSPQTTDSPTCQLLYLMGM